MYISHCHVALSRTNVKYSNYCILYISWHVHRQKRKFIAHTVWTSRSALTRQSQQITCRLGKLYHYLFKLWQHLGGLCKFKMLFPMVQLKISQHLFRQCHHRSKWWSSSLKRPLRCNFVLTFPEDSVTWCHHTCLVCWLHNMIFNAYGILSDSIYSWVYL